jgi:hypothetical protein
MSEVETQSNNTTVDNLDDWPQEEDSNEPHTKLQLEDAEDVHLSDDENEANNQYLEKVKQLKKKQEQ